MKFTKLDTHEIYPLYGIWTEKILKLKTIEYSTTVVEWVFFFILALSVSQKWTIIDYQKHVLIDLFKQHLLILFINNCHAHIGLGGIPIFSNIAIIIILILT